MGVLAVPLKDKTARAAYALEYGRRARAANIEKYRKRDREWRASHPETTLAYKTSTSKSGKTPSEKISQMAMSGRQTRLRQLYGMTLEDYDRMFVAQNGVCRICRKSCVVHRHLCVDHDHATGKVRGLLCTRCNQGIGKLLDDPVLLRVAADYLEKS